MRHNGNFCITQEYLPNQLIDRLLITLLQPKSCKEAALALLVCMQKGKCMQDGGTIKECLKSDDVDDCTVNHRLGPCRRHCDPCVTLYLSLRLPL